MPREIIPKYNRVQVRNAIEDPLTIIWLEIQIGNDQHAWCDVKREDIEKLHSSLGRYLKTVGYLNFEEGWTS